MTNTGDPVFVKYFMAGQMGLPLQKDATAEMKKAYERGKRTSELEGKNNESTTYRS